MDAYLKTRINDLAKAYDSAQEFVKTHPSYNIETLDRVWLAKKAFGQSLSQFDVRELQRMAGLL